MPRWFALLLLAVVACSGSGSIPGLSTSSAPPVKVGPPEYHALWVDAFHEGIHSRSEIDRLVETAHGARINALFVQVRKAGDAYYLKSLEPVAWDIYAPRTFDPLAYLVGRAHGANPRIEVHAWVNTFFVGRRSRVYFEHSEEWVSRRYSGQPGPFLDPGHPGAAEYTRAVLMRLATGYDLDGLHLDFIRYPEGGDWGYSAAAVERFNAITHREGRPDPGDEAWKKWRRDQLTAFVSGLYHELERARPALKLSAALIPWGPGPASDDEWRQSRAYSEVYQDWFGWLREGILDIAVPMNYDTDWSRRTAEWYDQWVSWEKDNQFGRRLIVGVGAYLNYPEDTLSQIRRALAPSSRGGRAAGVALYSYASTSLYGTDDYWEDSAAAETLPRQPYAAGLDHDGLAARARRFNDAFWGLLTSPGTYDDPVRGTIATEPVFQRWTAVPHLPWKNAR